MVQEGNVHLRGEAGIHVGNSLNRLLFNSPDENWRRTLSFPFQPQAAETCLVLNAVLWDSITRLIVANHLKKTATLEKWKGVACSERFPALPVLKVILSTSSSTSAKSSGGITKRVTRHLEKTLRCNYG